MYWEGFMHGWFVSLVIVGGLFYFDTKRFDKRMAKLRANSDEIARQLDDLIAGLKP
jgi:hypothetical protein